MYYNMHTLFRAHILSVYFMYTIPLSIYNITITYCILLYTIIYDPVEDEMTLILSGAVLGALSGLAQIYANKYIERRKERREAAALAAAASGEGTIAAAGL